MTKHDGKQQVEAMARLAGSEWKPDNLAGIRVGDYVELPNINARLKVIDLADPLLILEAPSGHQLKAGWRQVRRVQTQADGHAR